MLSILKILNWKLFGGLFLGWGVGANDSANIFGTAVATNSVKYKTAIILIAIFVFLGSVIHGRHLFEEMNFKKNGAAATEQKEESSETIAANKKEESKFNETAAFISTLAAAFTVLLATVSAVPASTSQAAIGAMVGIAMASHTGGVDWSKFSKMFMCWVLNPIGSAVISVILYIVLAKIISIFFKKNFAKLNKLYRWLLIIAGCYGAYELGANNVVVTTAPYYNAGMFGDPLVKALHWWKDPAFIAATIGGLAIAVGALTYSKKVMYTVGSSITALDPFSAMITVFAHSLSLMVFTRLKVPVSSSQAVVGAVLGIGLLRGGGAVSFRTLGKIFVGWILTPVIGGTIAFILFKIFL